VSRRALRGAPAGHLPEEPEPDEAGPADRDLGTRGGGEEPDPIWTLGSRRTLGDRLR
jgi:hypothetical protein